jgi:hypothetical protein
LVYDPATEKWIEKRETDADMARIRMAGRGTDGPVLPGQYVGIRCTQGHSLPVRLDRLCVHPTSTDWDRIKALEHISHVTALPQILRDGLQSQSQARRTGGRRQVYVTMVNDHIPVLRTAGKALTDDPEEINISIDVDKARSKQLQWWLTRGLSLIINQLPPEYVDAVVLNSKPRLCLYLSSHGKYDPEGATEATGEELAKLAADAMAREGDLAPSGVEVVSQRQLIIAARNNVRRFQQLRRAAMQGAIDVSVEAEVPDFHFKCSTCLSHLRRGSLVCTICYSVVQFKRDATKGDGPKLEDHTESTVAAMVPKAMTEIEQREKAMKEWKKSSLATERKTYRGMLKNWQMKWDRDMALVREDPTTQTVEAAMAHSNHGPRKEGQN